MSFKIACPGCSQRVELDDEYRGIDIECPACSREFKVPEADSKKKSSPLFGALGTDSIAIRPPPEYLKRKVDESQKLMRESSRDEQEEFTIGEPEALEIDDDFSVDEALKEEEIEQENELDSSEDEKTVRSTEDLIPWLILTILALFTIGAIGVAFVLRSTEENSFYAVLILSISNIIWCLAGFGYISLRKRF
jgi:hypothetical protein